MDLSYEYRAVVELVRTLKGAPSSVLWILFLSQRPHTKPELQTATGYSDKPVRQALDYLEGQGLLQRQGNAWSLKAGFQALALSLAGADAFIAPAAPVPELSPLPAALPLNGYPLPGGPLPAGDDFDPVHPARNFSGPNQYDSARHQNDFGQIRNFSAQFRNDSARYQNDSGQFRNFSARFRNFSAEKRNFSARNRNFSGPTEKISAVIDLADGLDPDQQQIRTDSRRFSGDGPGPKRLAALLRRMGVDGRAFDHLSQRPDLQADPSLVVAWWWYYRAQKWSTKPAGAAIRRLEDGRSPPDGYLALARIWPHLPAEEKQEIEERCWRGWSAGELANHYHHAYPELTADAFSAYLELYQRAPDDLDLADK